MREVSFFRNLLDGASLATLTVGNVRRAAYLWITSPDNSYAFNDAAMCNC